ncbi:MAG: hypothetical protein CM1200mP28_02730 [Deltaproteobacteria bacterium]|nr:MAG: hypothetical protein CM1200mP28_02730 [Deltaproteobacteria bacterium]
MSDTVTFKIKRQNTAESSPYGEKFFVIPYIPNSNVISCLMDIRTKPGKKLEGREGSSILSGTATAWKKFAGPVQWS